MGVFHNDNPKTEQDLYKELQGRKTQWNRAKASVTKEDAVRASTIAQLYPNFSPDVITSLTMLQVKPEAEVLRTLSERVLENKNIGSHINGLNFNRHTKAHLFRAGLEGIAFAFVYGINILKEMGLEIKIMRVGNDNLFQSNIFSKTVATLANCKIEIIETTGAVGAAKAAGVGIGIYDSVETSMKNVSILEVVEPSMNKETYEKAYGKWENTLNQLL